VLLLFQQYTRLNENCSSINCSFADRNVYGGGLSIKFVNIELLEVSCQEGNDLVSVLSTAPGVETKMYGSLGSDEFVVTPRNVEPVASKNLRGHRGILEHAISSNDTDYDKLLIEGVAVEVLDNDGDYGYINIVGFEVFHLLDEEGTASFSFTVFPTRELLPNTIVAVDLVPPSAINAKNYLTLNGLGVLPLQFTSMVPKTVVVRYNTADNPTPLAITDFDLMIKIDLNIEGTSDERFKGTQQSILPVDVKLLPGKANLKAKSVTVFQPTGRTVVAEGEMGFNATYNVLLRPCTEAMAKETKVTIGQSVTRQLGLSQFEIQNDATSWNLAGGCNVAITVFPFDDIDQEGDHFVTLSHVVTNSTDDPVLLSDNSTLFASNVLVRIYDDDIGSVIIQETLAVTSTAEMEETDKGTLNFDKALYEDEYSVRLTKKPTGDVSITVDSIPTATDRNLTSTAELKRDFSKRIQAHVGIPDGDDPAESVTIVFTNENWNVWQPIRVTAFNDNITEGVDLFPFPSQPSYLSFIQGPISLLGGASASFPAISDPFMLPGENDTEVFTPPAGAVVDDSSLLAIEEKQVDTLRIYNTDVRGDGTSNGTLTKTQLVGFNMGRNIVINGKEMLDGIEYSGMEVVEIFLGDGKDMVIVEDTTGAIHLLDTGGGDDSVRIKDISGPFIIHGQDGADVVTVSSTENKLDRIEALLAFDGGIDEEVDELNVDNSGSDEEDILFVSRQMVEFENLMPENATNLTLPDSFLIDLRYATEGAFILQFNENEEESKNEGGSSSIIVPYPINATDLESLIQRSLIPKDVELDSCGKNETTKCSLAVKVYEIGQTFAVFFVGERLNTGLNVTLDVGDLESNSKPFVPEVFDDATVNLLKRNSDIAYANLEVLDIKTGTGAALVNVRGTSVTTTITTQDKDDLVFISSEASQVNLETAASLEFLTGWLDYLEFDLTVNVGIGRHRLLISDENSTVSKGGVDNAAGPAELTWESLTKISDILGDFYYTAEGGNWSAGVNLWLGKGDDRLNVLSVPSNPGSTTLRTTTTVRAGPGEDTINIALREEDHQGTVFVANGEADNDVIDASQSTLGVILFGDGGDDRIVGGFGRDILFGDFGRVVWKSFNENIFAHVGVVIAVAGGGGYGDFTDGIVRTISEIFSISADLGGFDNLSLGSGDDIGIGGPFDDIIEGDDGNDILFGDSAEIQFHKNMTSPKRLLSTNCIHGGSDTLYGGPGVVNYLVGGSEGDKIYGNVSMDLAFGDHADIKLFEMSHQLSTAETIDGSCAGGIDTIRLGPGDDLAFGGAMGDIIYGDEGQDVIFGDFGRYDAQIEFLPFQNYRPIIGFSAHGGDDTIYGGADDDFIMGQEGSDTIYGESGRDDIYGGHSLRHGQDAGDTLNGGDHDDVILGDNGQIVRHRINFSSAYPWINGMVWETWPAPFDTEAIRGVRRYDDIDFIEGNDRIYGEAGNDILHGQRGDDYISGGSGEDEIYGELGSDILDGNSGNDILLGDVGYIVRRIDSQGVPILITKTDNADSTKVWKKDIVLEEVGNIEARHRISRKVNTAELLAEDVTSSSLLFVANAFDKDGDKYFDGDEWLTDLLLFKLNSVPDDDIIDGGEGDDVCIGQRGDDTLQGGLGNDLLIGDGGTNVIAQTMDMPRIYQVYRTLSFPDDSEFVNATDFGAVFSADYELYPQQYRSVDYLSSLVDLVVNVDDLQEKSNLLSDIIGVSALSTTDEYCMQPMFRITPGFLYETQKLHGNDMLTSGPGDSILIGDDIRGFTALDLTTELASASVIRRQKLDNLVVDLSVRMSTLEVDTEFFLKGKNADSNNADFNIIVGQDDITTDELGRHFVAGDSLTIIARSVRGGSLDPGNADATAKAILERLHDVEQVFHQVHLAMYEVHNDILSRAIDDAVSYESTSQHALFLANDRIDAKGDGDFVFGDSSTLFFQAHRPDIEGFEFEVFNGDILGMASSIQTSRDAELKDYVENILNPSKSLSDFTLKSLLFEDVPFLVTVGCDTIMLQGKDSLGVGDFGVMGLTSTSSGPPVIIGKYGASIEELRKRPSKDSVAFQLRLSQVPSGKMDFYYERYDQTVTDTIHDSDLTKSRSDQFVAESSSSAILGEYFTGYAYGQKGSLDSTFQLDTTVNAFDATCVLPGRRLVAVKDELRGSRGSEDRSLQFTDGGRCIRIYGFDGDNFDIVDGTIVDGQRGEDTFVIDDVAINGNPASGDGTPGRAGTLAQLKTRLTSLTQGLFVNHALIIQMNEDIFNATILPTTLSGLKTDVCTDSIESTYIPPIEDYIHPIAVTPLPTPLPTPSPTGATPGPTPSPTTPGQTHSPTSVPTSVPTSDPTSDPTPDPTHSPTPGPTNDSTPVPTQVPTSDPTPVPTSDPTSDPTPVPTSDPTPVPTSDPTPVPTSDPTSDPTPFPTSGPTPLQCLAKYSRCDRREAECCAGTSCRSRRRRGRSCQ
jgi:Ca2+-binding RTX toxin-like protein